MYVLYIYVTSAHFGELQRLRTDKQLGDSQDNSIVRLCHGQVLVDIREH
jgi:hypothetical protein